MLHVIQNRRVESSSESFHCGMKLAGNVGVHCNYFTYQSLKLRIREKNNAHKNCFHFSHSHSKHIVIIYKNAFKITFGRCPCTRPHNHTILVADYWLQHSPYSAHIGSLHLKYERHCMGTRCDAVKRTPRLISEVHRSLGISYVGRGPSSVSRLNLCHWVTELFVGIR